MIWQQQFKIEALNELHVNSMSKHLGIAFTEFGDDYLKATMPVDNRTKQPMGILHGGASVALAETLGSVAGTLCIKDLMTHTVVGLEINANHLKSAKEGYVIGVAKPIRIGRTVQVWEIKIYDPQNTLICVSRLTLAVISRSPKSK